MASSQHRSRPLRSYKLRTSRVALGQQAALDTLLPRWGLPISTEPLDFEALFGRRAGVVLEIGFGMGETTVAMASADPSRDVLAVDVHTPGVGTLLRAADAAGLTNVRVAVGDAVDVLRDMVPPGTLNEIRIFFPDPWPKNRHHKRRLVSAEFVALAASRLRVGGRLHLATDWADYAHEMLTCVTAEPLLDNTYGDFAPRPAWRPVTRFEAQGLAKGHQVFDVLATRRSELDGASPVEVVEVVAAAIVDDLAAPGQLLAARRTQPDWAAGRWELPGGKRELGEDALAALRRELVEELGVQVEIGDEIPCPTSQLGWPIRPGYVMRVWWAQISTGEPQLLSDHDQLRWLEAEQPWVSAVDWLDADIPIITELQVRRAALVEAGD